MAMQANDLNLVCDLVRRKAGIELDSAKEYLVEARLLPLARKRGLATVADVIAALRVKTPGLERDVVDVMTTNETSFFRDMTPFEALKKTVFPDLIAKRASQKRLNIWCAASSTGQEPYTIAMLLRENFPLLFTNGWQVTFVASDLSRDVLNKARAGRFSQLEVNRGLPAALLAKHFSKQGLEWEISPAIRSMITFQEINLLESWPAMQPPDLVFIRNVLIYFSQETKRQILGRIRGLMRPDGYLFLGAAETTLNVDDQFVRGQNDRSGCYQLKSAIKAAA
jgi:chemotaxis protein methyltransferase CheR